MDTFEREVAREKEAVSLSTSSHKSYDYGGKSAKELARQLEERDRKIEMLEKHIHDHNITIPNWPRCYPFLHIDIENEVPARRRNFCRMVMGCWYFTFALLVTNCICLFIAAQSSDEKSDVDQDRWNETQWLSLAWLLGIPVSFPLWFYTTYQALVGGKQYRYKLSLFGIAVGIAGATFALVGILGFGTAGIFTMFKANSEKGNTAFLMMLGCVVGWCAKLAFLVFAFIRQWYYKRQDAKIANISEAAATMIARAVIDQA